MQKKLRNLPFWLSAVLPVKMVLDRRDGWIRTTPVRQTLWLHRFNSQPWLVVQGKSADWAAELEAIESSPFFRYYKPTHGDVVVSVGAGIGTEAFIASRLVGMSGKVIAIEGDPTAFSQLVLGIKYNEAQNISPFFCLVTEKQKWANFSLGQERGRDFTTSNMFADRDSGVSLIGFTLDQIFEFCSLVEPVDLLLMNIEGAEYLALLGLSKLPKRIVVSCHDFLNKSETRTFKKVYRWLAERSYEIHTFEVNLKKPWEEFYLFGTLEENL